MSGDSLQPSLLLRGQKQPLGTSIPNPKGSYLQVQAHPYGTAWSCPHMWLLSVPPPPAAGCESPASNMVTLQGCSHGWGTIGCGTGDKERLGAGAGGEPTAGARAATEGHSQPGAVAAAAGTGRVARSAWRVMLCLPLPRLLALGLHPCRARSREAGSSPITSRTKGTDLQQGCGQLPSSSCGSNPTAPG